jgi:hypothetical protein
MIHSNDKPINFAGIVDNLVLRLDERIKTLPYIEDEEERAYAAGDARDLLFRIWNFMRNRLDVKEFCKNDRRPTPLDGAC